MRKSEDQVPHRTAPGQEGTDGRTLIESSHPKEFLEEESVLGRSL